MVRATYAEVYKLFGGVTWPAGWTDANVTNLCAQVDAEIDGKASPSTFGTGTNHVLFANMLTYRRILHSVWALGPMTTQEPIVWTTELQEWFEALLTDTTADAVAYLKMQDTS